MLSSSRSSTPPISPARRAAWSGGLAASQREVQITRGVFLLPDPNTLCSRTLCVGEGRNRRAIEKREWRDQSREWSSDGRGRGARLDHFGVAELASEVLAAGEGVEVGEARRTRSRRCCASRALRSVKKLASFGEEDLAKTKCYGLDFGPEFESDDRVFFSSSFP